MRRGKADELVVLEDSTEASKAEEFVTLLFAELLVRRFLSRLAALLPTNGNARLPLRACHAVTWRWVIGVIGRRRQKKLN